MTPLELLRAKIANFPGYDDDLGRRRSDEYVRAYLGEALTNFAERLQLPPALQKRADDLLLRVEFTDFDAFAHLHGAQADSGDGGAVAAADAATIELADRAASLDEQSAAGYFDDVTAQLDERDAAIRAAAAKMSR
ncbi:MAG TPA: hypothetical protein VFF63_05015 [Candidatus Babeliales bacterium]|nr:hypothetical protein [Candidatus Babeliales bacterium]